MTTQELLESTYFSKSERDFNILVEDMRRKASKGLLKESSEELESAIQSVFDKEKSYDLLENEADEAIEKFSYLED